MGAILKIFAALIVALVAIVAGLYAYMGGFHSVQIARGAVEPMEIAYAAHKGSYATIGESWGDFAEAWEEAGLGPCDALAVYLDPPDTPPEDLRSILACRIDGLNEERRAAAAEAFPTFTTPASPALTASFPYKNELSFVFAPLKVYPEMQKRMQADAITASVGIELYGPIEEIEEIRFATPFDVAEPAYDPLRQAF